MIDKKLERGILDFYKGILPAALSRDANSFLTFFDKGLSIIGAAKDELIENKLEAEKCMSQILPHIVGDIDVRNRKIQVVPLDQLFLVIEQNDFYTKIEDKWEFFSKTRISTIIKNHENGFKVLHQHVSIPGQGALGEKALAFKKLEKENEELKEAHQECANKLETSLAKLNATQSRLIQSERMASFGEITAGIAHEIQNPLNFVNNFSELSSELLDEMNEEIAKENMEEVSAIAYDIKQNLEKINHHGQRAANIVKGILQHSRKSAEAKESTDINNMVDEFLRLAYHGFRAKDKTFNTQLVTDFDEGVGQVNIVAQDISRVILNLITNAFYAVNEKKKNASDNYQPTVTVKTRNEGSQVSISVIDNGDGIPPEVLPKIFQPFFTTKPEGQGTGLGLSLSYDIVQAHQGELEVECLSVEEAEGDDGQTIFKISLPKN